ncbi:SDR family oxidoreductase [Kibdelosporangium aridum]|nr:SDR family oxidoreductase [Kibdelosporangium aridum]
MTDLKGKVALVAGGTRGASRAIAVELGRAGAFVYVTGRSSGTNRSEVDRPETIEQTLELIEQAGGKGTAIRVDHLERDQVEGLAQRIDREHGRLDILVDGIWGGDAYLGWGKSIWEQPLNETLRMIRLGIDAHLITSHHLFPLIIRNPGGLVVEMTDGTEEYNANYRAYGSLGFYLAKATSHPLVKGEAFQTKEYGTTVVAVTPGWMRSEAMLDAYGVTEDNWRDATKKVPYFVISETPTFTGRTVAALAADPDKTRFSGQTLSSGQLAKIYQIDDVDGSRPDCWRYIDEVQDLGKDPDPAGYR